MKKLKTIAWVVLMVLTCAGFAACSDDDDDEATSNDYAKMIVGTWSEKGDLSDPDDGYNYGYIFYSNGKYVSFGSGNWSGVYEIIDKHIIFDGDYEDAIRIISITNTKLVLDDEIQVFYRVK